MELVWSAALRATSVRARPSARVVVVLGATVAVAALASGRARGAEPSLPATVRVTADHTYLRAGPGDDFYPTERLPAGSKVEVWAVDPAGYVAVRPVEGSFSWLRGSDIEPATAAAGEPAGRAIGVIVTDGAVSRVGSQINGLRHVAQVALEAGERVRIIDEVRVTAGRHAGTWVRIEPPAGEFRWARLADIETPPGIEPPVAAAAAAIPAEPGTTFGEAIAAIKDASVAVTQAVNDGNAGTTAAAAAPAGAAPPPDPLGFIPSARKLFGGWLPRGTGVLDATGPIAPVAVSGSGTAASMDELADIDLSLALAVTGPPEQWNLAPVRERLRQVAARSTTDVDRLRVEAIDARIARFEAIQSRHQSLATVPPAAGDAPLRLGSMWSSLSAIGSRPVRPGVLPGGGPAGGQPTWTPPDMTETTGRLATVVSRRPDAPRWAVVDANNNVIAFITPQAGVNLAPLVGQDVSVRGARGYMPEYKRPYVVAAEARVRVAAAPEASPDRATR